MTPKRQIASFGKITHSDKTIHALPDLTLVSSNNLPPSAQHGEGEVFKYQTPKQLLRVLLASQSKQLNGHTILEKIPDQRIHERNMKLLLEQFKPEVIYLAIMKASFYCKHPYSTKIIKFFCQRLIEDEQRICRSERKNAQT